MYSGLIDQLNPDSHAPNNDGNSTAIHYLQNSNNECHPEVQFHDIDAMYEEFTMNTEQARAFRIIAEHSMQHHPTQLRMFIGGAGGTGKSRVISALREWFQRRKESRRFRLSSYTGVAARHISGMTLHSALSINQRSKGKAKNHTRRDLVAMWEGVGYLFIDEVSMIGCNFLLQISEALTEAKGNTAPFGGINVIFAGDFAQLPPVGQTRLYSHISTHGASTKQGQDMLFGKLLWLSVRTVVILRQVMRQQGEQNQSFVSLLERLRVGKCTEEDYTLLNSRLISQMQPSWENDWKDVPIVVCDNDVKDAFNAESAATFARRNRQSLNWYYCNDHRKGREITDEDLRTQLIQLHSGKTNQRLGRIPLVLGMPVMITQNFDVNSGIVNGCTGVLQRVRYTQDSKGNRHATSCVVNAPSTDGEPLPNLEHHQVVALQDSTDLTFIHPYSKKRCTIKRTQVPIIPAFAMTVHKAQGQTFHKIVIDLESCKGTESPYVMVSRVTHQEKHYFFL